MASTRMGNKEERVGDIRRGEERGVGLGREGGGLNIDLVTEGMRGLYIYSFCQDKACDYNCHLR